MKGTAYRVRNIQIPVSPIYVTEVPIFALRRKLVSPFDTLLISQFLNAKDHLKPITWITCDVESNRGALQLLIASFILSYITLFRSQISVRWWPNLFDYSPPPPQGLEYWASYLPNIF